MFDVVQVTQQDINSGVRGDPARCPVAIAFNRRYVNLKAEVGKNIFKLTFFDHEGVIIQETCDKLTDSNLLKFITDFDAGKKVKPFNIEVMGDSPVNNVPVQDITR